MVGGKTKGINDVGLGQASGFAPGGRLVTKECGQGHVCAERRIEIALALHGALRNLIQVAAHPRYLKLDLAFVESMVTIFAQTQQIRQRIFSPTFTKNHVMCF